jgi:hypothetical protein
MKKSSNGFIKGLLYFCIIGVFTIGLMAIIASGGGGGGDSAIPEPVEQATIDSSTAPKIASGIGNITTGINAALVPITLDIGSGVYCPKTLLGHADELIFNAYSARAALGVISETEPCPNGGSATLTLTWDGPDNPADCSQVQNPRMEYSFTSCRVDTTTMNGTMGIYFVGDLCTENPSALSMYFTNFRYQNQVDSTDVTMNFTMDFSNIQYNQYDYMVGINLSLDGYMRGTFEGTSADLNYNDWTLAFSNIKYDQFNKITEITATVDGSFFGSIAGDQFSENYENIIIAGRYTTVDSIPGEFDTLNGRYRGACLDGWVTIETIDPIFWPESGECPTAGQIKISGNGEATIEFKSDSSVTINVGGEELNYTSCDDLPTCS